jgi:hypothetical protein
VYLLPAVVLLAAAILSGGRGATAQNPDQANHPAVGTWIVHRDPEITTAGAELLVLHGDGTAVDIGAYQTTSAGGWAPTGPSTATVTLTAEVEDGPGNIVIRASITVAPDGKSFSGTFTSDITFDPAHNGTSGEIGPGKVMGSRMPVQAPGTPVMSFQEFLPHGGATPVATPSS